jgi:hypothetical protein
VSHYWGSLTYGIYIKELLGDITCLLPKQKMQCDIAHLAEVYLQITHNICIAYIILNLSLKVYCKLIATTEYTLKMNISYSYTFYCFSFNKFSNVSSIIAKKEITV